METTGRKTISTLKTRILVTMRKASGRRSPMIGRLLIAIPRSVNRVQRFEGESGVLELLADATDVTVDAALGHVDVVGIGCGQQLLAAQHHARVSHERLEQTELGERKRNERVVPEDANR